MAAAPIEIMVLSDEPFQASYLASILQLELPGLFHVRHRRRDDAADAATADLVLVQADAGKRADARPLAGLVSTARSAPVIVVARGILDLAALDTLLREGADDVLDLAQLNTRALAAAVLKAVRRRAHSLAAAPAFGGPPIAAS